LRQLKKDLNTLKDSDLITIILYCLYKLTDKKEYSVISELAYILDKDSFYNLCATLGGTTITIPTLDEYKKILNVLLAVEYVSNGESFETIREKLNITDDDLPDFLNIYELLVEILNNYE